MQDNLADNSGVRHNFRIVMANSDRNFLYDFTNRLSNDRFPVTVIENEETAYYDVGLRLRRADSGASTVGITDSTSAFNRIICSAVFTAASASIAQGARRERSGRTKFTSNTYSTEKKFPACTTT